MVWVLMCSGPLCVSTELKRNAIIARPFTLADWRALVTCPVIVAPVGRSSTPSIATAECSVARTVSATLLVSEARGVVSVAESVAPERIVSSRNSGAGGGGGSGGGGG